MIGSYLIHKCKFEGESTTFFNDPTQVMTPDIPCRIESRAEMVHDQRNSANEAQVFARGVVYVKSLDVESIPDSGGLTTNFIIRPGNFVHIPANRSISDSGRHVILNIREQLDFNTVFYMVYF